MNNILSIIVDSNLEHGTLAKTYGQNLAIIIINMQIFLKFIRKMHVYANSTQISIRLCPQGSNGMSAMRLMNNCHNFLPSSREWIQLSLTTFEFLMIDYWSSYTILYFTFPIFGVLVIKEWYLNGLSSINMNNYHKFSPILYRMYFQNHEYFDIFSL